MLSIKGLSKDVIIYAFGNLAQSAVTLILLPLYTSSLTPSDYGLLETVLITTQILVFLLDIGMSRSVLRYYARHQNDPRSLGKLIASSLAVMIVSASIIISIGILARGQLSFYLFGSSQYSVIFIWTLVSAFMQTLSQWAFMLFRARRQSQRYVIASIFNLLFLTTLTIILVRFWRMGIIGVLLAQVVVYAGTALVFLYPTLKSLWNEFEFSPAMTKQLFKFGFPLIFASSGMLVINGFDRFFLLHYWGLVDVGIYTLSIRIASILGIIIVTPFQLAWAPFLFEKEGQEIGQFAARLFTYLIFGLAAAGSVLLFYSREIILLLSTENYLAAQAIVPFTLGSMIFMGIYYWAAGFVNFFEQTWKLSVIVFFGSLCNVIINVMLTPKWGWWGSAWADMLARLVLAVTTMVIVFKHIHINLEYKRIFQVFIVALGICSIYFFALVDLMSGMAGSWIKLLVLALGLVMLLVPFRFVTQQERKSIFNTLALLRKRLSP